MQVERGMRVRFLNEVGEGIVKEVQQNLVLVDRLDGFDEWWPLSELVVIPADDQLSKSLKFQKIQPKDPEPISIQKEPLEKVTENILEVDLHMHKLLDDERTLPKWDMLQYQLNIVRKTIASARKKRQKKIVFIHGIGQGVLKEELHKLLKHYDKLEFYDASYQKYGRGATEVTLF